MTVFEPLGITVLAQTRLGDGSTTTLRPRTQTLGITYTVSQSKYANPLAITYTVERHKVAPVLLYYTVIPASQFAINGNGTIISPDQVTYALRPVANRTVIGGPLLQGVPSVTWNYSVLQIDEFDLLLSFYNSQASLVMLTYPDEHGTWRQRQAVMQPPSYGTRQTMFVYNISLTFLFPLTF